MGTGFGRAQTRKVGWRDRSTVTRLLAENVIPSYRGEQVYRHRESVEPTEEVGVKATPFKKIVGTKFGAGKGMVGRYGKHVFANGISQSR